MGFLGLNRTDPEVKKYVNKFIVKILAANPPLKKFIMTEYSFDDDEDCSGAVEIFETLNASNITSLEELILSNCPTFAKEPAIAEFVE